MIDKVKEIFIKFIRNFLYVFYVFLITAREGGILPRAKGDIR